MIMLYAITYAIAVSFLAVLFSVLWKNIYRESGLTRRLFSHFFFLPIYLTISIIFLNDGKLNIDETNLYFGLSLFNGLIFYILMFFVYESILSKVERSVTIKIFLEIYQRGQIAHNERPLDEIINKEKELLTRINGLLRQKFIVKKNNLYRVTTKGSGSAKILSFVRNIFWTR